MNLEASLRDLTALIPDCIASGYVDMGSGLLLGLSTPEPEARDVLDALGGAVADILMGTAVPMIEPLFHDVADPAASSPHFQEMIVFTENFLHITLRTKRRPDHVLCCLCRKPANIGMTLAKARQAGEALTLAT